ncbi:ABC transporter substrate-binding protein [Cellulomonas cellasea]|uniref:ABC-type glycerol-3-phosphate transport system substrate-binding protein n=1 Tax=Cellulomonas cellasea TaxID=43670 RepID=A0A7W4YAF2_9CELL|nr:extracellular solute-binding protein [Cellulomonas cellasea]MBB2921341.1 ABC-type glycerol-3-phosphate transport system substrate-binding protein [Cellulomonas cellasea]
MKFSRSTTTKALTSVLALGLAAACAPGGDDAESADGEKLTLSVVSLVPGSEAEAFAAFDERVAAFEAANPDIDVESEEYEWEAATFASQLAGGTLPDVFEIPLTDAKTLIANGQLANLQEEFSTLPYADQFNKELLEAGKDDAGEVYAIPAKSIYGVALHYNRALFQQAGLDPDSPPTSWDQVREYAKQIKTATGVPGYATIAASNAAGWQLAAATYARGGRLQEVDGDTVTATVDNDATHDHLEFLKALRWEDDSILADTTLSWETANQAFAAGQFAMYTSGSDIYNTLVENYATTGEDYGLTAIPLDGDDAGVLAGGTMAAVGAEVDEETQAAAVKWIDFFYLSNLLDEEQAIANAEVRAANNQTVGTPVLPIFSREQYETANEWVAQYINVPLEQMEGYTSVMFDQPVVGEPSVKGQDTYAALEVPIQSVLTDANADVEGLLETANQDVQTLLDEG